jgi:hypothetical protein
MASKRTKGRSRPAAPANPRGGQSGSPAAVLPGAGPRGRTPRPDQKTWFDEAVRRIMNRLGSLQMAVILLTLFAAVLAIGTMMESWYSAGVAQFLVYRTWWFGLLMLFLATNIFFAAVKKMKLRGPEDYGRDLPGTSYGATIGYWWPWLLVVFVFAFLFVSEFLPRPNLYLWRHLPLEGPLLALSLDWEVMAGGLDSLHWTAVAIAGLIALAFSFGLWTIQMTWPLESWWPWQRHQTGFLITHVGLLTMVAGGVMNSLWGTDSMMLTVDSPDESYYADSPLYKRAENRIFDRDRQFLKVAFYDEQGKKGEEKSQSFSPGPLTWHSDQHISVQSDSPLVSFLGWLQHPLPRFHEWDLGDGYKLQVQNYYPSARIVPYVKPVEERAFAFPALRIALISPAMGELPSFWLGYGGDRFLRQLGVGQVHMLGVCSAELMGEFLEPPHPSALGAEGTLVIAEDGMTQRINVATARGGREWIPVGQRGRMIKIIRYMPDGRERADDRDLKGIPPSDPIIEFDMLEGGATRRYFVYGHAPGVAALKQREGVSASNLSVWYHPPDYRYGRPEQHVKAVLQFVRDRDSDKLHYRSFSSKIGGFNFENSGAIGKLEDVYSVWGAMNWKFQVVEYMPRAEPKTRFVPENKRPGFTHSDYRSVVRAKLTKGNESQELWLMGRDTDRTFHEDIVQIGGRRLAVRYLTTEARELPFSITLQSATRKDHPGTNQPADYTSIVRLDDPERGINDERRVITMNEPLNHRGYKLYQTSMERLENERGEPERDSLGNPIMQSGFTVGHDPGLPFKYAGMLMLGFGIFCMFYMRAYFFKSRGRPAAQPPPPAT